MTTTQTSISPFEYERHMIPPDQWFTCGAPAEAVAILREESKDGGAPIGLAKHPTHGWAVLASGQGPFVVWSESITCIECCKQFLSKPWDLQIFFPTTSGGQGVITAKIPASDQCPKCAAECVIKEAGIDPTLAKVEKG